MQLVFSLSFLLRAFVNHIVTNSSRVKPMGKKSRIVSGVLQ